MKVMTQRWMALGVAGMIFAGCSGGSLTTREKGAGVGALGGAFWGLLFGLLFFVPLLGMAVGAATGALTGSLSDVGIDDNFINSVRDQVTPGTSALFVMTSDAVQDKVFAAVKDAGLHGELVRTNLSDEQETKLRETFSE